MYQLEYPVLPYKSIYNHPFAMKVSRVVNMIALVSEIKKKLYQLEYPVLPYIPILMKFCTNRDKILHTCPSKQEKSHCLHGHAPFHSLLAGVPGVLMSLEMTTRAICLKRYSFINFCLVSLTITTSIYSKMHRQPHFRNSYWTLAKRKFQLMQ